MQEKEGLTLVGSFPEHDKVARLEVSRGVGTKIMTDSPCEIDKGEHKLHFAGTGTYSVPIETEEQMDPEPAYYFSSGGPSGNHLHEVKTGSSVQWAVPDTFGLIQIDGDNVNRIYGVTSGACLGSSHGLQDANIAFSLCVFEKQTGIVSAISTWDSRYTYDVMDETSALNPVDREYALLVYDSTTDTDLLCIVNLETKTWATHPLPAHTDGEVQSMHYDTVDDSLLISIIQGDRTTLFHIEFNDAGVVSFMVLGDFQMDARANQHYTLLSTFDPQTEMIDKSAYYSVLFENSLRQYDIIKTEVVPSLDAATQATTESTYVVMANVKMMISHLYVDKPYRVTNGKDSINTPSVIYMGNFERLTFAGEPIEIELHVNDIDTLDLVNDITLSVISSDNFLLEQEDIKTMSGVPDNSPEGGGWPRDCRSMCLKMQTPNRRLLKLTPRQGLTTGGIPYEGTVRVTVQADDGFSTSSTSFVLFVSPRNCSAEMQQDTSIFSTARGDDTGCGWEERSYNSVPKYTQALDIDNVRAGNQMRFAIQTRDQFNHPVDKSAGFEAFFNAEVVLDDTVVECDVSYSGGGGIYVAETAMPLNSVGTFYVTIEINFLISNAYIRYTGLQIGGSPYRVRVVADVMEFRNSLVDGVGTKTVRQGTVASFEGNRVEITPRDRYFNICPAVGTEHFGITISWPEVTATLTPTYSNDGIYYLDYWAPDARYEGSLEICEIEYLPFDPSATSTGLPAGWVNTTSSHTGTVYYTHIATGAISNIFPPGVGQVGSCVGQPVGAYMFMFSVYALPFQFWKYNGPKQFDAQTSYLFALTASASCTPYPPINNFRRRKWDGVKIPYKADGSGQNAAVTTLAGVTVHTPATGVPACEAAKAGERYTWYIQTLDEFGDNLIAPVTHWNGTDQVETPADDFLTGQTYTCEKSSYATSEYFGSAGIYAMHMNFTRAGTQDVHVFAHGVLLRNNPYEIHVTAADLSAAASYADGSATVMAQEGTRNSLEDGNILLIHAMDIFGNTRETGDDFFALDPLTQSSFSCDMTYEGKGIYVARFWWQVQYVQTYEICPRRSDDPVGAYDVCLSRCTRYPEDCEVNGVNEIHPVTGDNMERTVQRVNVFIRPNEGTPFSAPDHSATLCMNDWSDVYACQIYTGAAGIASSFSIEGKNELDFPNYRGQDFYVATLTGIGTIPAVESSWLRIQFYELSYMPFVAGTYAMNVYMCDEGIGNLWDHLLENLIDVGTGHPCNPVSVGNSPYTVVITPGSASPQHSAYTFPPTFDVGSPNRIVVNVQDAYSNVVLIEEAERLLHVTAQKLDDQGRPLGALALIATVRANITHGDLAADMDLLVAGWYTVNVKLNMVDILGIVTPTHITASPTQAFMNPGVFSIQHTEIRNYNLGASTTVICSDSLFMDAHAMDQYGNEVSWDGLQINIDTAPAGITSYMVFPEGSGAYSCPYVATVAGDYTVFMDVTNNGVLRNDIIASPYSLTMEPAAPNKAITTGGGLASATAGIQSFFYVELQDQFGNTRHRRDDLRTVLRFQEYHCTFGEDCSTQMSAEEEHHDVSLNLPLVQGSQPEEGQYNWLEYMGMPDHERDRDGIRWTDPHQGRYIGTYTSFKSGTFRPTFDLCPPSTHNVLIDGIWYDDVNMHHHGVHSCPYFDAAGIHEFEPDYDRASCVATASMPDPADTVLCSAVDDVLLFEARLPQPPRPDRFNIPLTVLPYKNADGSWAAPAYECAAVMTTADAAVPACTFHAGTGVGDLYRLDGTSMPFPIAAGDFFSGQATQFDEINGFTILGTAGTDTLFEFYLKDQYDNRRDANDATATVEVRETVSGTGLVMGNDITQYTVEYGSLGAYRVRVRIDASGTFKVLLACTQVGAVDQTPQPGIADEFNQGGNGIEFYVSAAPASALDTTAAMTTTVTAGDTSNYWITLKDRFLNVNQLDRNLTWDLTLNGPATFQGSVSWVYDFAGQASGQYQAEYAPLSSGVYAMGVQIVRSTSESEPIGGSPFQILVRSANAVASRSTANGLGVIRTDPGFVDPEDDQALYDPNTVTTSVFMLVVRDLYDNFVTPADITTGGWNAVEGRLSVSFSQDCADPGTDPVVVGLYRSRNCPSYTSDVPLGCTVAFEVDASQANGNFQLSYSVPYDSSSMSSINTITGLGGTWCGGNSVDYAALYYNLRVMVDGQDIMGSPFRVRSGKYEAPRHQPFVCTPATENDPNTCTGAYTETGSGREMVRTPTMVLNVEAGAQAQVMFQNIFREGALNCENEVCAITAPDNTMDQYDSLAKAAADFQLEAYKWDGLEYTFTALGNQWVQTIDRPVCTGYPSNAVCTGNSRFDNAMGIQVGDMWGRWTIDFALFSVPNDMNGYEGSSYAGGTYQLAVVAGGEQIDGCPFEVTVRPAPADATRSVVVGCRAGNTACSDGLLSTEVDVNSDLTIQVRDAFDNPRPSGDTVAMEWATDVDPRMGGIKDAQAVLETAVVHYCRKTDDQSNAVCALDAAGTTCASATPDCIHGVSAPRYLQTYSIQTFTGQASFYITVNGARSAVNPFRVPCTPGPISEATTEVVVRDQICDLDCTPAMNNCPMPLPCAKADAQTMAAAMIAGENENIFVQAKDSYGNLQLQGGNLGTIRVQITVGDPRQASYTQVVYDSDATPSVITMTDYQNGQYRIRYGVQIASPHSIAITVNGGAIPDSPFISNVVHNQLDPGSCMVRDSGHGEATVGTPVRIDVDQKDQFGNIIQSQQQGLFSGGLLGVTFPADALSPTRITFSTNVVGQHPVDMYYQEAGQARLLVGEGVRGPGKTQINFRPQALVEANTILGEGVLRTQDCIAGAPAVFYLQTRDQFSNNCDGRFSPAGQEFSAVLTKCNPPTDRGCPGLMPGEEVIATTTNMADGTYKVNYTVASTGFYQLVVMYNNMPVALPGSLISRDPDSYVVLSDTAAVPQHCLVRAPGTCAPSDPATCPLMSAVDVTAGALAQMVITSRGQTASGDVVVRQGSGDEFQLSLSGDARLQDGQTSVDLVYQTTAGITGRYSLDYTAIHWNHTTPSWQFTLDITLNTRSIAGMPTQVTMVPGPTAAHYTFASGVGVHYAVAGISAGFTVTGRDAYNNVLEECGTTTPEDVITAWAVVTGSHSNLATLSGEVTVPIFRTSCLDAVYQMAYDVSLASEDWMLHLEYGIGEFNKLPILHAPFGLRVSSGVVSAAATYVAASDALSVLAPTPSGGFSEGVAGEDMIISIHAYDHLQNRLTQDACTDATTGCFMLGSEWCQTSRNVSILTAVALGECPDPMPTTYLIETTNEVSVYKVTFSLQRSGTYSLSGAVEEVSGSMVEFGTINVGFAVAPAAAAPDRTVWTPSTTAVAQEFVQFFIRARDQFDNFVDTGLQTFDASFAFTRGTDVAVDPVTGGQVWINPFGDPIPQQPEWLDPPNGPGRNHSGATWVQFDLATRQYLVTYMVLSGGAATRIDLSVGLQGQTCMYTQPDGTLTDACSVNVRAAQNVAGLCYVMNNRTGPDATRALDLSRDLTNLDQKMAGEDLIFYIQSMTPDGPRADFDMCNPAQAVIMNAGGTLPDGEECELLDEFDLDCETTDVRGYAVGPFAETCETTACPAGTSDCTQFETNDCARVGQYKMTWTTTISGDYQLNVLSFGIQIQDAVVQSSRGGNVPAHYFDRFMPFQAYVLPAAMDAATSQAFVGHTLERNLPATVTVIGRDRFGNLLDRDGGQAGGIGVLIQALCDGEDDSRSQNFQYYRLEDGAPSTGQFQGQLTPRFGGPSAVQVFYDPAEQNTGYAFNGTLVGHELMTMVKLDIGRPSPNLGELGGGTVVRMPVYGACRWNDQWQPTFTCKTSLDPSMGAAAAPITVPAVLGDTEVLLEKLYFHIRTGPTSGRILWELRLKTAIAPEDEDWLVDNKAIGGSYQGEESHMDFSTHGVLLPITAKIWAHVHEVGTLAQTVESNDRVVGGDYYDENYKCTTAVSVTDDFGSTILRLAWQACITSVPEVDGDPLETVQLWTLPPADYEFIGHNVSANEATIELVAELDSSTVAPRNVSILPQVWKDGTWSTYEETSKFQFTVEPVRVVTCEESPRRGVILGRVDLRQTVELSVGTQYNTTDPRFRNELWYNPLTEYDSSSHELFYYYPHPTIEQVKPADLALRNATQHWGADGFQFVYAAAAGGMPVTIYGSGFNVGADVDADQIRCVLLNKQCAYGNTTSWRDNPACVGREFDRDMYLNPPQLNLLEPFVLWTDASVRESTGPDDAIDEVTCLLPPFGTFTGDLVLEVTMNAQNMGQSSTWIKVYDIVSADPSVSAIGGGTEALITLANGDPNMVATCRFGSFARPEGALGGRNPDTIGLPYRYATHLTDTQVSCLVPDVACGPVGMCVGTACLDLPGGCEDEPLLKNTMTDVTVSFDEGVTFCSLQEFFYYEQPSVALMVPEVGPTSGGTLLRMEMRAGIKYVYQDPGTGSYLTQSDRDSNPDYSAGAAQFNPGCLFTDRKSDGGVRDPDAIITAGWYEVQERSYRDDFASEQSIFSRDERKGYCDAETLQGQPVVYGGSTGNQGASAGSRQRCQPGSLCTGTVYTGLEWRNISWVPLTWEKEGYDPGPQPCFTDKLPYCLSSKEGPCHDASGTYLSQQVNCFTPTNPTPGAAYYVDISLDGRKYAYEDQNTLPRSFGYFADVAIITMDANDKYNAATAFRTAVNNNDATVAVRFAYSCGYSRRFESTIRCNFGNQTTKGRVGTLQFGADVTNQIGCEVPLAVDPSTTTIQVALNGIDFTDITTQTAFTYYGTPMQLASAYVTSVWLMDEQYQFTIPASRETAIKSIVTRIVDEGGNYVSQSADYGSQPVSMVMTRTFGGTESRIEDGCRNDTLQSGQVGFENIVLAKPKAGGRYIITVSITEPTVDQECPPGHQVLIKQHMRDATDYNYAMGPPAWNATDRIGPSPTGPNQIGCIAPALIELVVIIGPTEITNSIIVDGSGGTTPPDVFINPGSPFSMTVQARDSADNNRIDGGDIFNIWAELIENTTEAGFFNPQFNRHNVKDMEDGTYRATALVRADMQRDDQMNEIRIWGRYEITVQGENSTGQLQHIDGSPVKQVDNTVIIGQCTPAEDDYQLTDEQLCYTSCSCVGSHRCVGCDYTDPRIDPVDCTLNDALEGASPTNAGDSCLCDPGFEKGDDQSGTAGSIQHVVCIICPLGKFKASKSNEDKCQKCPTSTHTVAEGATTDDLCVCEPGKFKWTWPGAGTDEDDTGIEWDKAKARQGAIQAYCVDSTNYFKMPKPATMDLCSACPPCLKCFGNDTIALEPGYWSDTNQPFVAYICMPKTGNADDMCVGGSIHMQFIFDLAKQTMTATNQGPILNAISAVGNYINPGDMADDELCNTGGTGPTCANCDLGFKRDKKSGKCDVCDVWLGLAGINWQQLIIALIFVGAVIYGITKIMKYVSPKDILKMKILVSFGQVLQSFASTYNVTWPPELKGFIAFFDILNFDVFSMGSLECEFPGIKNYYTRFWSTVMFPIGFTSLIYIVFKSKMKAVHLLRKSDYKKSALEVKIEDIEIEGNFISRVMAVLIFMYLKVSQTVLDMFKCRDFAPSPDYTGPLPTNRKYLQVDLTLNCVDALYQSQFIAGIAFCFVYPLGIPGLFGFLLFRERDQIHDAVNKKKYGFLFKDYAILYFFWEIWDLMRKLLLSGALVFFNPGSVAQVIVAMMIALMALQLQLYVMPYQDGLANWIQILAFCCIFLTLFGALLTKIDVDKATDPNLKGSFVDNFLVVVNSSVPLIVLWSTAYSVAYDFYMTSVGQRVARTVEAGHRATLGQAQAKAAKNAKRSTSTGGAITGFFAAGIGATIAAAISLFWKREDVESHMLTRELELVREKREARDQARIMLAEAKLQMHEKREWLRFLQNNSHDKEEFQKLMDTESIDIYRRLILGMDVNTDKSAVWGDFAGEDLEEAYENPIFQRRYKMSNNILTVDELERQIRTEFRLMR